jgi:hypothetical protein
VTLDQAQDRSYIQQRHSWSMKRLLVIIGCILLTKSLLCNVAIIMRDTVFFRVFITSVLSQATKNKTFTFENICSSASKG